MFDGLLAFLSAWREILHISEWSGIGLGLLACIAAGVYFIGIPIGAAIRVAALVITAYVCLLIGDAVGARDKQKQWDAARAAAETAQVARDRLVEQQLEAKYRPQLEALQKQAQANKDAADGYQKKIVGMLAQPAGGAVKAGGACQLGSLAGRLHLRR